jgi:hypothetical protein
MLHLFVPPTFFDGWGEHPSEGTTIRELLPSLLVIVSLCALALTICIALGLILSDGPLELTHPNRFPIPAYLTISYVTTTTALVSAIGGQAATSAWRLIQTSQFADHAEV